MNVMSPDDLERSINIEKGDNIIGMDNNYVLVVKNESEGKLLIKFNGRRLTRAGMEMLSLVKGEKDNQELCMFVGNKIKQAGAAQVTINKVVNRKEDGRVEYLIAPEYTF
jgi:hypothetical protein